MASLIKCDNGHNDWGTRREAARKISQYGDLGKCSRCGENKHYIVSHYYPYDKATAKYEVLKVYMRFSDTEAEKEGWDPMVFLMKDLNSGEKIVWPYYWTKNRKGKWANGQFPPLLSIGELKKVIKSFEKV